MATPLSPLTTSVLLSRSLAACSSDFDAETGVDGSLPLWADALQHLDGDLVDVRDLLGRSRLSKRALTTATKRLARLGLVELHDKSVVLTAAGAAARDGWRPVVEQLGTTWPAAAPLRTALVTIVSGLELEHPHFPVQYGTADSSITGGPGQDWKPVPREGTGGAEELPLVALLSQAFVALAIAYESRNGALGWVAKVVAFVPKGGAPIGDLPPQGRRLLSGLERHGWITVDARAKEVAPTSFGSGRRAAHQPTLDAIESEWSHRFGAEVVGSLRASLADCVTSLPVGLVDDVFHAPTAAIFGYGTGRRP